MWDYHSVHSHYNHYTWHLRYIWQVSGVRRPSGWAIPPSFSVFLYPTQSALTGHTSCLLRSNLFSFPEIHAQFRHTHIHHVFLLMSLSIILLSAAGEATRSRIHVLLHTHPARMVARGSSYWCSDQKCSHRHRFVITTIRYDGTPYLYTHRLTAVLDDQVTMGPRRSLQINSSKFEVPTQEDNVMCGVLVTCPHQVVSEMTQYPQ